MINIIKEPPQKKNITIIYFLYTALITTTILFASAFEIGHIILPPLLIAISALHLYLARKDPSVFLLFCMIFYFNYSIIAGEYLGIPNTGMPEIFFKPTHLYMKMLELSLLFNIGIGFLSFSLNEPAPQKEYIISQGQPIIVWTSIVISTLILIFEIDRAESTSYTVKISEIYEYSALVVLIGLAFSRESPAGKKILLFISGLLILEDLRHGGRITSVRILLAVYLTSFYALADNKKTVFYLMAGIVTMSFVGAYRGTESINIIELARAMTEKLFVFDTVVYAYYASVTHLMLYEIKDADYILSSIISLANYIFLFGYNNDNTYNLTREATEYGFINVGGGVSPSFIYFWFGYPGVFIFGLATAAIYKYFHKKTEFGRIYFIALVSAFPRWFLYSPWIFPKIIILLYISNIAYKIYINIQPVKEKK